jgi:uncharacterized membrane protein YheB (UPF0754 family)
MTPAWLKILGPTLLGALAGWLAVFTAVRLLFWPRRPVRFLGLTIQGIIPRRKAELVQRLGEGLSRELAAGGVLENLLAGVDLEKEVGELVNKTTAPDLGGSFIGRIPGMSSLAEAFISQLRPWLAREAAALLVKHRGTIIEHIRGKIDPARFVAEKAGDLDWGWVEEAVGAPLRRDFAALELLGAAVGLVAGCLPPALEALW